LVASLPFDHFSQKQRREIVSRVTERLYQLTPELSGRLGIAAQPASRASTLPEMSDRLPITQDSGFSKQVQVGLGGIQITTLPQPLSH
jgi:hypothetical protein